MLTSLVKYSINSVAYHYGVTTELPFTHVIVPSSLRFACMWLSEYYQLSHLLRIRSQEQHLRACIFHMPVFVGIAHTIYFIHFKFAFL